MDPLHSIAGALVGILVGLTGVGGGSLMAPILILMFGFNPAVAIGTDLWFAAITKSVGAVMHQKLGSPDWRVIGLLALGSVPAAIITLSWLALNQQETMKSDILLNVLGAALLLTAALMLLKGRIAGQIIGLRTRMGSNVRHWQFAATIVGGFVVGGLVTLTSVGAGALVAVLLTVLYPFRLSIKNLVGTDVIHAVPLTLVAALGHSWLGHVDIALLASLLVGSIPGIIIGASLSGKIEERFVRYALATVLCVSGAKMLLN